MAAELEVTHNDIYRDVRALLLDPFQLPSEKVIRGYSNNVPLPNGDFILMNIINETDFVTELNKDDYNYINIILEKTRINFEKAFDLLKK